MKQARRRNFDARGNVITPGTVFEAEEMGAVAIYLLCMECGHKGEMKLTTLDPEAFVPDIGLGKRCSKCQGMEIESWIKHGPANPPKPISRQKYLALAERYGIADEFKATLAKLDAKA